VHVALTRSGTTLRLFVNGVQRTSATNSSNITGTSYGAQIGLGILAQNNYFVGYVSNVRVVKGTALYTADFTPSVAPLTAVVNTSLLTCQTNRFVDNSTNSFAITPVGPPSVQAFSPFYPTAAYTPQTTGGSGYFDGNGDYLTGNGSLSTSTSMSTFTVEGWLYPTSLANNYWIIGDMDAVGATNVLSVRTGTNGDLVLYWYDGAIKECFSPNGSIRANQWNWFAIVVNNNAISMYINSTTAASLTGTTTLTNRTQTNNFAVSQYNNSVTFLGYISNLRWSSGIARTISSIPTAPYISDANTRLLLNFTNAGIVDSTAKNVLETVGNAQISTTQSKFGGSSIAFDGTGDYLVFPANPLYAFGTGDFTVEAWVYPTSNGWNWGILTNGSSQMYSNSAIANTGASTVPLNTWTHLAFVRTGGTIYGYVNGVQRGSTANTENFTINTFWVGITGGTAEPFFGYIDDLRITRFARYTGKISKEA
jgi:hypothetical protein